MSWGWRKILHGLVTFAYVEASTENPISRAGFWHCDVGLDPASKGPMLWSNSETISSPVRPTSFAGCRTLIGYWGVLGQKSSSYLCVSFPWAKTKNFHSCSVCSVAEQSLEKSHYPMKARYNLSDIDDQKVSKRFKLVITWLTEDSSTHLMISNYQQ